ncbi:MAG: papain-like cysteine peptidase, partial [Silvanigrellaceae bacterium]|nr:papain-like cysteine peptidase [Silvanigrellaceae bacterium]
MKNEKPIFISLGSYCTPALMIKHSEYSIGSFPIDWVLSIDGEGLIVMLQENFANFLNLDYLQCDIAGYLINNYYRITFSHEGSWHQNKDWKEKFPEFFERMERRINRFKNLNNLKQKVYFIRKAWPLSTHPNYNFTNKENLKISDDYAIRLYESLKVPLPDLDYRLIILNPAENEQY